MKPIKKAALFFALVALMMAAPVANAATVTYSGSYSGPTDLADQLIGVSRFDPSLGTLLSVEFQLDATMNTSAYATNDGDFYAGWDKMTYEFSLMGDADYNSVAISASNAPIRIVGTGTPGEIFSTGTMERIMDQPAWTHAGPTLTDSGTFMEGALDAFIGTGDLSFFLSTANYDILSLMGQGSPSTQGISTNIIANVSATYEYTPIPIPAAFWLFISGLVGLAGLRRKVRP